MSTPKGGKDRKLQHTLVTAVVVAVLSVVAVFAYRGTQAWEQDLDRGLQSVQQSR